MTIIDLQQRQPLELAAAVDLPCQQADPELFFSDELAEIELAKAHCRACPLASACLAGALERREAAGVWGGELLSNGAVVARKRPRGRPRKNPVPLAAPTLPIELRPVRAA